MIEFYIHVGVGKTGTTAIQSYLDANFEFLNRSGLRYFGQSFERAEFNSNISFLNLFELADSELDNFIIYNYRFCHENNIKKVFIVNESWCVNYSSLNSLVAILQKYFIVKIILFVRDHADWAGSAYKQWGIYHKVNSGKIPKANNYFENELPISYETIIVGWQSIVGADNIIVKRYNSKVDSVKLFFDSISEPSSYSTTSDNQVNSHNLADLYLRYLFNKNFESPVAPDIFENLLGGEFDSLHEFNDLFFNEHDLRKIDHASINDKIFVNKYLSKEETLIDFPDRSETNAFKALEFSDRQLLLINLKVSMAIISLLAKSSS